MTAVKALIINVATANCGYPASISANKDPIPADRAPFIGPRIIPESITKESPGWI